MKEEAKERSLGAAIVTDSVQSFESDLNLSSFIRY